MKKEEIKIDDLHRIFIGKAPLEFLLEVCLRTVFIYLIFLVVMRLFGKRMSGQLNVTEMGIVITLGAIIAPMMQLPDKGLLQGVLLLVCMLLFHRGIASLGQKSDTIERITSGKISLLVKEGIIQIKELEAARISRDQLFMAIRSRQVYNLAKVERLYLEPGGTFSLFVEAGKARPGLPLFPEFDDDIKEMLKRPDEELQACCNCGNTIPAKETEQICPLCGEQKFEIALI